MDDGNLPRELEQFATEAVAAGRYRDRNDVLAAGLSLLQRQDAASASLVASLDAALAEGERDGFLSIEEVERDMDVAIEKVVSTTRR